MKSFPNVNWWPGNLLPYESALGFAVRFCTLNNLNLKQFEQFFGFEIDSLDNVTGTNIQRIAELLNEDLATIKTIFSPSFLLGSLAERHFSFRRGDLDNVRFCEECARCGFHSFLHEVAWLSKCPIHETYLKEELLIGGNGTKQERRFAKLKSTMEARCQSWPYVSSRDIYVDRNENFNCLLSWAKNAVAAHDRLFKGFKWSFSTESEFGESTLEQCIGQFRSLEVIPKKIEHLFTTLGDSWSIQLRRFPLDVRNSLNLVTDSHNFGLLFDCFKFVGKYANKAGSYMEKLSIAQEIIKQKHTTCQCNWARRKDGFYHHWIQVDPDGWPHWCCTCPYEVAIDELELAWGRAEKILSKRKLEEDRLIFLRNSKTYYDAGFIGYTPDANVDEEENLSMYQKTWPCCEWVDNFGLGELLNAIAEFEIDVAFESLNLWLSNVADGGNPGKRSDPNCGIYLCEYEEGLILFKWMRKNAVTKVSLNDF